MAKNKNYNFDFYQCVTRSSDENMPERQTADVLSELFQRHSDPGRNTVKEIHRNKYELRMIEETDYGYRGIIGKHRENDLPHAAVVNGEEREITLAPNENLLEKAHFTYHVDYSVLIMQRNHYCISSNNMGKYLSIPGYATALNPVIEPADLQWLMNNSVQVRTAEIAIARPRNPDLFRGLEHDFNNTIISTLNGTGTAKLNLSLRGDAHSRDPEQRYLSGAFKRGIREMQTTFDVKKCKLLLENQDTQMTHPVDLVADRLFFDKTISVEGRYPPTFEMWSALAEAREEKEAELVNYFGSMELQRLA